MALIRRRSFRRLCISTQGDAGTYSESVVGLHQARDRGRTEELVSLRAPLTSVGAGIGVQESSSRTAQAA